MLICGFPLLLLMAGLLIDGGTAIACRERAADLAAQTARTAADQITAESLRTGNPNALHINQAVAQAAGQRLLHTAGATGTITVTGPDTVEATAEVSHRTAILSMVGITHVAGRATSTAILLHGVPIGAT